MDDAVRKTINQTSAMKKKSSLNSKSLKVFCDFRRSTLIDLSTKQTALWKELFDAIPRRPERLIAFIQNKQVIDVLLVSSVYRCTIYYSNSAARDAFRNRDVVTKAFKALEKAWKGAVKVTFSRPRKPNLGYIDLTIQVPEDKHRTSRARK